MMTRTATAARRPWTRSRRSWWQALAFGTLWGVAVSTMETVTIPVLGGGWSDAAAFVLFIVPGWAAVGIAVALLVEFAGAHIQRPVYWIAGLVVCSLACSAFWSWLYAQRVMQGWMPMMPKLFPHGLDPVAAYTYQTWMVLFYGGFYCHARRLGDRAERTREILGEVEVARIQAERRLADVQLEQLRGHLDPALLLRVMTEVDRRYARAESNADQLLALLVSFLRLAMPGVHSGRSTLQAEMTLVRAYAELLAELESRQVRWMIEVGPMPDVPFPALLLLPLLDAFTAASSAPFLGELTASGSAGVCAIALRGPPLRHTGWIGPELERRLHVGLSALYGDAWSLRTDATSGHGSASLVIVLRPRSPPTCLQHSSTEGVPS